ncbi:MAG: enoyl-CoA hydratase/isomerase family protein [Microbacteriaceae bacterium]
MTGGRSGLVLVDRPGEGVRRLTLDRPEVLNAMNAELVAALHEQLDAAAADPSCRIVILTGAGRGFSAGLDLQGYGIAPGTRGDGPVQRLFASQQHIVGLISHLRRLPVPVIAAVNGPAAGGGFALVLGSDVRIAARSATFNAAFVRIGLSGCDIGTSWLLPKLVGVGRAHELMLTGRIVDAAEAARIGLVLDVVDDDDLERSALEHAASIARNSPMGVRMTKEVMWSALEVPGAQAAIDLENRTQVMLAQTDDHREAVDAFVERRAPVFHDR